MQLGSCIVSGVVVIVSVERIEVVLCDSRFLIDFGCF